MRSLIYTFSFLVITILVALIVFALSAISIDLLNAIEYIFMLINILTICSAIFAIYALLVNVNFRFNFFFLSPIFIVLGSAGGAMFSYINLNSISEDGWNRVLLDVGTTTTDIVYSQAITNTFSISLLSIGYFLQKSKKIDQLYHRITISLGNGQQIYILLFIIAMQLYLLFTGVVVYGGKPLDHVGQDNHPLESLLTSTASIVPFVAAYHLFNKPKHVNNIRMLFYVGALLIEIYWFFLHGRRNIVFCFILILLGITFKRVITFKTLLRGIVPLLIASYFIFQVADFYNKMRTVLSFENVQQMNIIEAISYTNLSDIDYDKLRKVNLASRSSYNSLALAYFVNLFATTNRNPLYGKSLKNTILYATPSSYFVNKKDLDIKESLYAREYAIDMSDISETIYLESYIDFGVLGAALIYPGLLALSLLPFYTYLYIMKPICSLLFGAVIVYLSLAMIETDTLTFLVAIRSLLLYLFFYLIFGNSLKETT